MGKVLSVLKLSSERRSIWKPVLNNANNSGIYALTILTSLDVSKNNRKYNGSEHTQHC